MVLSLGTAECNPVCVCVAGRELCNGNQPLYQEMLLPHSTAAEAHWWEIQKSKDKRGRGTCELPQDRWANLSLHHSAKQLGICSVEGRVGVEIRPGLYVGREAMRQKQVPAIAPCPRASLTSTIPCRKRQTAVPLGSLVPRLREKVGCRGWGETNQAVIVSKWWGLKDCRSLSESLSVWTLSYPLTEKSLQPSHERSPASLEYLPMPDPGLGALQGKGHHDSRQC